MDQRCRTRAIVSPATLAATAALALGLTGWSSALAQSGSTPPSEGSGSAASKSKTQSFSKTSGAKTAPPAGESGTTTPAAPGAATLPSALGGLSSMLQALPAGGPEADPVAASEKAQAEQEAKSAEQAIADTAGVKVSEYLTVDIFVQDEDLANVLQMLSLQSRKNIVASRDVSATVSANLYGVTFYEALDAILNVNGYGYLEKGSFIYVYTLEELQQIKAKERKPVSKVMQLNYLNATDAAEFVTPLLSDQGQIKTNGDVGQFSLPADNPTGSEEFALAATLVIYDFPENVAEIEQLLTQLDTRPAQVLVEATILQTALTEANAFGVDFSVLADVNFTDFLGVGGPLSAANVLQGGETTGSPPQDNQGVAVTSSPGNTAGPSTIKLGVISDDVAVFIRALDEVTDTTILSNPKVLALNRQPAKVLVGRKIGYLNTTSTETSTTQTVEFLDTGTQLAFRPFVAKDGSIRLELKPRVSEGVIRDAADATGASVTIPDEITQEITTNVIVPDGSTVVLGGLFKETTRLGRSQVPLIGDIPIIGAAFRGHDDSTDRAEIIFLIRPTIVSDRVLADQGDRANNYSERVRTGSRNGLLPWSRDRQTKQLNVEAERLAAAGETEKARWTLRRSLELQPSQPDVLRLQDEIGPARDAWPATSVLEKIIREESAQGAAPTPGASSGPAGATPTAFSNPSVPAPIEPTPLASAGAPAAEGEPVAPRKAKPASPPRRIGVRDDTRSVQAPTSMPTAPAQTTQVTEP